MDTGCKLNEDVQKTSCVQGLHFVKNHKKDEERTITYGLKGENMKSFELTIINQICYNFQNFSERQVFLNNQ